MLVMKEPLERTVLGVPITCFQSQRQATACVVQTIRKRERTYCVAINPEKVCFARGDEAFREIVRKATFHVCDGAGTAAAVRILWGVKIPRITGIELFFQMLAVAEEEDLCAFLLGARPEAIERARQALRERHPRLRVAGCLDGYFHEDESESVVQEINASGADMLFVALGSPKQERWIARYRSMLETPFCMGVGGSFDVLSGRVKRAPRVFRRTGTEWLYRLAREPWRWRRQTALIGFALSVLREKFRLPQPRLYRQGRHAEIEEGAVSGVAQSSSASRDNGTTRSDSVRSQLLSTHSAGD